MRIAVVIPCLNEEEGLALVLSSIPRHIPNIPAPPTVIVVDDGSDDRTAQIAALHGVRLLRHPKRLGLAAAFQTGLRCALSSGAEVIVNLDGDWQYSGADIPRMIAPILSGDADIVIGDRSPGENGHFSPFKRAGQRVGRRFIGVLSRTQLGDPVSGFRAFTRDAASRICLTNRQSHTIETIFIAGRHDLRIREIPVATNAPVRRSRLAYNSITYMLHTGLTACRCFNRYRPVCAGAFALVAPFCFISLISTPAAVAAAVLGQFALFIDRLIGWRRARLDHASPKSTTPANLSTIGI